MATISLLTSAAGTSSSPSALPAPRLTDFCFAALPTRGAISAASRRARIAKRAALASADDSLTVSAVHPVTGKSHSVVIDGGNISNSTINVHFNGRRKTAAPTNIPEEKSTGDHSIIVDASAPAGSSGGGIKNSTINLTVISRRSAELISSFALSIRSLFDAPDRASPETRDIDALEERERVRRARVAAFHDPAASRRARRAEIEAKETEAALFADATSADADADGALPTMRFVKRRIVRRSAATAAPRVRFTADHKDLPHERHEFRELVDQA